ncbi:putative membrane protein [Acinetobacter baumannii 846928]|nr:putative membrane protein [Acinetobacter baumannii 846928]
MNNFNKNIVFKFVILFKLGIFGGIYFYKNNKGAEAPY